MYFQIILRKYPAGTGRTMYVHCTYNIPLSIQNYFAYSFGSHSWMYIVCTGPYVHTGQYVQFAYRSVRILYVNELVTVSTVHDLF